MKKKGRVICLILAMMMMAMFAMGSGSGGSSSSSSSSSSSTKHECYVCGKTASCEKIGSYWYCSSCANLMHKAGY